MQKGQRTPSLVAGSATRLTITVPQTGSSACGSVTVPLEDSEGAEGDTLLEVWLKASESALADYEWVEEDKPYREWLVPAAIVNPLIVAIRIVEGFSAPVRAK